jgi:DNA-binding NtrC family response regulator
MSSARPRPPPPSDAPARGVVLVIDDEESIRHAVRRGLERAGFRVEVAATGREGVARLRRGGLHAVVTDVRLPDLSGLDVLAVSTELDATLPVFVITGFASVDTALEAMRRGARNFVTKPFDVAVLARLVADEPDGSAERALRARVERVFEPARFAAADEELRRGGGDDAPPPEAPPDGGGDDALPLRDAQRRFEVRYVEDLLGRTGGNVAGAARLAGISRPNFHRKLRTLGVDPGRFKRAHRRGRSVGG